MIVTSFTRRCSFRPCVVLLLLCASSHGLSTSCLAGEEVTWKRIKIDDAYRSEGVAAADVNRDGLMDVLAGDVWYEQPDWNIHAIRTVGQYDPSTGYSNSFLNWAYDVNQDGWPDLVLIGFPGAPCYWYENPKGAEGHWPEHEIWYSACNESPLFTDVTGDGLPELVLGSTPDARMGYLSVPAPEQATRQWTFTPISLPGNPKTNGTFRFYHGLGAGDVNNDGRLDVFIPDGLWKGPTPSQPGTWEFQPWRLSKPNGDAALHTANIYAEDLDLDGDNDLIASSAHDYGIWWFENNGDNDRPKFTYHLIDESFSQTHALHYVDINGDGQRDIVTGKRYFAHNGHDPGGMDPVVMYWYEVKRQKGGPQFIPHEIQAGHDTGIGTQFTVLDFDGNGTTDIVLSNKKGVNVLLSQLPGR